MGKVTAGRVLVIIGLVLTLLALIPLALAVVLGFFTNDATGHAFVPFLLLVVVGMPILLGVLVLAAILTLIGVLLGAYRGLGIVTLVLALGTIAAVFIWFYGVDAGWF